MARKHCMCSSASASVMDRDVTYTCTCTCTYRTIKFVGGEISKRARMRIAHYTVMYNSAFFCLLLEPRLVNHHSISWAEH